MTLQESEQNKFVAEELKKIVMVLEHEKLQADSLIRDLSMKNNLLQEKLSLAQERNIRDANEILKSRESRLPDQRLADRLEAIESSVATTEAVVSLALQQSLDLTETLNTKNLLCDEIARDLLRYQELTLELSSEVDELKSKESLLAQESGDYQELAIALEQELDQKQSLISTHAENSANFRRGILSITTELRGIHEDICLEEERSATCSELLQTMRQDLDMNLAFSRDFQAHIAGLETSSTAISANLSRLHTQLVSLTAERENLRSQVIPSSSAPTRPFFNPLLLSPSSRSLPSTPLSASSSLLSTSLPPPSSFLLPLIPQPRSLSPLLVPQEQKQR
eukprot:767270-Hanusia_phi.AAC.7